MNSHRLEYEKRINRVIDHVRAHLAEDLSLERLAHHAAFSPFHFHRIFWAITNETLFAFIQRLRLERAAVALIHHPDERVLAVDKMLEALEWPAINCRFRGQVDDPATSRRIFPPRCACATASLMEERG